MGDDADDASNKCGVSPFFFFFFPPPSNAQLQTKNVYCNFTILFIFGCFAFRRLTVIYGDPRHIHSPRLALAGGLTPGPQQQQQQPLLCR